VRRVSAISAESKTESSPKGEEIASRARAGAAAVRPPDNHGFLWIDRDGFAAIASVQK